VVYIPQPFNFEWPYTHWKLLLPSNIEDVELLSQCQEVKIANKVPFVVEYLNAMYSLTFTAWWKAVHI